MIGTPGFMPPPQQGPINDTGGFKSQPVRQPFQPSPGQFQPVSPGRGGFNPTGGLGQPTDQPFPGQFSFQGGPMYQGGGPGWMPPPPIQGFGDGGGGFKPPPQRLPPSRMPPIHPGGAFGPPVPFTGDAPLPGWAGYLQWLNFMGGRMPPPPIQGY